MIEVRNLVKQYDSTLALDHLSFVVEDNQIFGFLGPNGAGKSTTMNILTGYLAPTEGTVKIDGYDIVKEPIEAKKRIGYLPEIPPVYMEMTPVEFLTFVGEVRGLKKAQLKEEINRVLEKTHIKDVRNQLIKTLSKGYRQRVGMAQALMGNTKIIVMDEPTVGLDPIQIIEFRKMIKEMGKDHTIIISSHILPEISELCSKIMIIVKGRLVAIDTAQNLVDKFENTLNNAKSLNLEDIFVKLVEKENANEQSCGDL